MSNSSFCLEQRQQEEQKSHKLLMIGLVSSFVLHGAIGSAAILFKEEPKTTDKPIELIVVDAPKPVPEVLKPKQEPLKPVQVTPPPPKPQPPKIEPIKTVQPQAARPEPAKPKIGNRRASSKPGQSRAGSAPKPRTIASPEPNFKPSQPQSRPSILTNPNPSASSTKVPEQPKVESNSPVVPSEPGTGNNSSQGTGTGNAQGSGNGSGTSFGNGSGNGGNGSGNGGNGDGNGTSGTVATRSTPEPPKPIPIAKPKVGNCVRNCDIKYPSVLSGVEGTVFVRLTVDNNGNVINVELAQAHSNSQINELALLEAKTKKFAPRPGDGNKTIRYKISFVRPGTDSERLAREREERNRRERQARAQQERQAREREQQRQAELEQERRARQQQQQQPSGQTPTEATPPPEPIPSTVE